MADSPYTHDAMESVLDDIRAALWRALGDNFIGPMPSGEVETSRGLPALKVWDPETGHTFVVTVRPE